MQLVSYAEWSPAFPQCCPGCGAVRIQAARGGPGMEYMCGGHWVLIKNLHSHTQTYENRCTAGEIPEHECTGDECCTVCQSAGKWDRLLELD